MTVSSSAKRGKTSGSTLRMLATTSLLTLFLEASMASLRSTSAEKRIHQPGYPGLTCLPAQNLLQLQTPLLGRRGYQPQRGGQLAEAQQHLRHPGAWSGSTVVEFGSSPGNLPITDGKQIHVGNTIPRGKDAKIIIIIELISRVID